MFRFKKKKSNFTNDAPKLPTNPFDDKLYHFQISAKICEDTWNLFVFTFDNPIMQYSTIDRKDIIATIKVTLPIDYRRGEIKIIQGNTIYSTEKLLGTQETHILDQAISFYHSAIPENPMYFTDDFTFHVRYYHSALCVNCSVINGNPPLSEELSCVIPNHPDTFMIDYTFSHTSLNFSINGKPIAEITPQIYLQQEPLYDGWVLSDYKYLVPFFSAGLAITEFQITV